MSANRKATKEKNTQTFSYFEKFQGSWTAHKVIEATVKEIIKLAEENTGKKIKDMTVLDVGSGFGPFSFEMAKYAKKVVGVEPDSHACNWASKEAKKKKNLTFHNSVIEKFSTTERFDLALSLATLEHMPHQEESYRRVLSLMKKNSMLYLTCPNKWWISEVHYALPFLSWLPLPLANKYVQLTGKAKSYEDCSYTRSYFAVKKLFDKLPCTYEFYVPPADAAYLGCGQDTSGLYNSMRKFGISLIKKYPIFWSISKGFILIVKKN